MFDRMNLKVETEASKQNGFQIYLWNVSTQDEFLKCFKLFLIQRSLKFNGVIVVIVVEMQVEYYRSNPQQGTSHISWPANDYPMYQGLRLAFL